MKLIYFVMLNLHHSGLIFCLIVKSKRGKLCAWNKNCNKEKTKQKLLLLVALAMGGTSAKEVNTLAFDFLKKKNYFFFYNLVVLSPGKILLSP